MPAYNLHTRRLNATQEEVGALVDSLAGYHDGLWATHLWPEMRFDRPLGVGAVGGHVPIRYTVEAYVPGRWIRFRFTAPRGFDGFHEFTVHPHGPAVTDLHHLMAMRLRFPAWLTYPLLWRQLHDALLEDTLDLAERLSPGPSGHRRSGALTSACYERSWPEPGVGAARRPRPTEHGQTHEKSAKGMRASIVGAGIGGLTTAIALRRAGIETTVFERAGKLREVGAGLLLAANAVRVLDELGLSEKVRQIGTPASTARILSWHGETLADVPTEELEKRLGAPSAAVHRADLQGLLLQELGEENVRLGAACSGFEQDAGGVTGFFADGSEERADALIGTDGLYSTIRTHLFGSKKPRYAGYTAWRAVVEPDRELLPWGTGFESWGRGERFGCAHIGEGKVYWFATKNTPEGGEDGPLGTPSSPKAALMELFGGWHRPVPELIAETGERAIRRDGLYDREPLAVSWGTGRVTLLGDAAHPMTPNLGQGACQAIEDAVMFARCLEEVGEVDVSLALRRYEELRRERVAWIVRRSRTLGRVGQLENPILCQLRDAALKATPAQIQLRQFERVMLYEERSIVR